ncbi:MotA/TolQ/ExbB proton channel family protein [uncultured Pseudodesulfovibrio sp.]|uniref:MotA/TolQ/ExbB proton channel family protein n=1 Tax=uncultured Pseudodesulfovibrio sp. TaxID=2035858 RepID=UPI0029C63275|nr:MotA/TolQ/ExbB proton channel family protein [uncultured Pseudodesulfovibrio sp.]
MNILQQGGFMMWPLLILSIAALAVIGERFIIFTTRPFPSAEKCARIFNEFRQSGKQAALEQVEKITPAYRRIFEILFTDQPLPQKEQTIHLAGEEALHALNHRLDFLSTVATTAPLMGLLGTVLGMINAFSRLSAAGDVDISMLAGGIWQALLTTAAGLSIAIPTLLAHRWFCRQQDKTAYAMQHAANTFLEQQERTERD